MASSRGWAQPAYHHRFSRKSAYTPHRSVPGFFVREITHGMSRHRIAGNFDLENAVATMRQIQLSTNQSWRTLPSRLMQIPCCLISPEIIMSGRRISLSVNCAQSLRCVGVRESARLAQSIRARANGVICLSHLRVRTLGGRQPDEPPSEAQRHPFFCVDFLPGLCSCVLVR